MGLQAIPDHQKGLSHLRIERLQEFHDLFFRDSARVQAEHDAGARQSRDGRDVAPVEVKLDDGHTPLGTQVCTRVGRLLRPDSSMKTI